MLGANYVLAVVLKIERSKRKLLPTYCSYTALNKPAGGH
jgi:hypothetical protein